MLASPATDSMLTNINMGRSRANNAGSLVRDPCAVNQVLCAQHAQQQAAVLCGDFKMPALLARLPLIKTVHLKLPEARPGLMANNNSNN